MIPNAQPTLPSEIALSDIEQYFLDLQPLNLWPVNQNSNFGLIRLLLASQLEDAVEFLDELANETFVDTASGYLGRWEDELGLPKGQGGRSDTLRRATILSRLAIGPFSRSRRAAVVEAAIQETFGSVPEFTSTGIPIDVGGIILHAESGDISTLYRIDESIERFSYDVKILNMITVDEAWLRRELDWMTPGGISYTITYVASL